MVGCRSSCDVPRVMDPLAMQPSLMGAVIGLLQIPAALAFSNLLGSASAYQVGPYVLNFYIIFRPN